MSESSQQNTAPQGKTEEKSFSILPHPAKSNDPADLQPEAPVMGGGLSSNPVAQAYRAKQPFVPSQEILNSLDQPAGRAELQARQVELNN